MTNQVVIFENETGSISIIMPAFECGLSIEEIAQKDTPDGVAYKIIEASNLPADVTFRNAWVADLSNPDGIGMGPEKWSKHFYSDDYVAPPKKELIKVADITTDMAKARMVWRTKMAIVRDGRIADMNRLYQAYIDNGIDPAPIVERRTALREVTQDPAIDAAKTPEELKAVWPSILDDDV
jgi:hypothetical protein